MGFEDGGRGQDPRNARNAALEARKGKKGDIPRFSSEPLEGVEGTWPCPHLASAW